MIAPAASAEPLADPADAGLAAFGLPPLPYPGLRPFEHAEWPIFFGRERMVDEVVKRLADSRLVFVHGASGCGKSSLIRAGVRARLENEHARFGVRWRVAVMRPGSSPLWHLAEELARAFAPPRLGAEGTGGPPPPLADQQRRRGPG
ncbi:MAG TPA: hypothetical protein VFY87_31630 [Geminicoccaceae bacterium]|nr:hypothetical protein [Geminicoccaceae bacterium]